MQKMRFNSSNLQKNQTFEELKCKNAFRFLGRKIAENIL